MNCNLFVVLSPKSGNHQFVYNDGDVIADVTLDGHSKASGSYSFFLYSEQLVLLGNAQTGDAAVQRHGRTFTVRFADHSVWLPGKYFFLMRTAEGEVYRFDLRLTDDCNFRAGKGRLCGRLSDEDLLSGFLVRHAHLWKELTRRPGAAQLKRWAIRRARENELNVLRAEQGMKPLEFSNNILLTARSADHTSPVVMLLKHVAGLEGELKSGNCASFYDITNPMPYDKLTSLFHESSSDDNCLHIPLPNLDKRIYTFFNIGALTENGGKTMMSHIRAHWPSSYSSAIFCGTRTEMDALMEVYPSLEAFFPACNRLSFEAYTLEEVILTFFHEAELAHLQLSAEAVDHTCHLLGEAYDAGVIAKWNWHDIRCCVRERLLPLHSMGAIRAVRADAGAVPLLQVRGSEVERALADYGSSDFEEALDELNRMVGLSEIKKSIATLSHRMRFFAERRHLGLPTRDGAAHHAVFTGNPGTGKTTVARLLGKVYHALGLLSRGEVVCVDRARIIGRYVGETEENMTQILREARGNVLFVDEAYTLYCENDSRDFGRHAVECLLDLLSRKDPDMIVIFAGYEKEMDALMSMNPGLVGRFPYRFHFPDYGAEELVEIARRILSADQYHLTDEADSFLSLSVRDTLASRTHHFGNARWMEQYVRNGIIPALADRVSAQPRALGREAYQQVELCDVQAAYRMFNSKTIELKQRRTIGFCA
ncbi:MAG: AAA family ATPase [Bacteroidaceae bacterium]|nr:AAA family ATPase [Bacteroidaceae bacterium]